jgi:hypothetical protein
MNVYFCMMCGEAIDAAYVKLYNWYEFTHLHEKKDKRDSVYFDESDCVMRWCAMSLDAKIAHRRQLEEVLRHTKERLIVEQMAT